MFSDSFKESVKSNWKPLIFNYQPYLPMELVDNGKELQAVVFSAHDIKWARHNDTKANSVKRP
jgi:hypothetical protein